MRRLVLTVTVLTRSIYARRLYMPLALVVIVASAVSTVLNIFSSLPGLLTTTGVSVSGEKCVCVNACLEVVNVLCQGREVETIAVILPPESLEKLGVRLDEGIYVGKCLERCCNALVEGFGVAKGFHNLGSTYCYSVLVVAEKPGECRHWGRVCRGCRGYAASLFTRSLLRCIAEIVSSTSILVTISYIVLAPLAVLRLCREISQEIESLRCIGVSLTIIRASLATTVTFYALAFTMLGVSTATFATHALLTMLRCMMGYIVPIRPVPQPEHIAVQAAIWCVTSSLSAYMLGGDSGCSSKC